MSWCAISPKVSSPSIIQSPTAKHHCVSVPCSSSPWSLRQRPYSHQSSHVREAGEGEGRGAAALTLGVSTEGGVTTRNWLASPSPTIRDAGGPDAPCSRTASSPPATRPCVPPTPPVIAAETGPVGAEGSASAGCPLESSSPSAPGDEAEPSTSSGPLASVGSAASLGTRLASRPPTSLLACCTWNTLDTD